MISAYTPEESSPPAFSPRRDARRPEITNDSPSSGVTRTRGELPRAPDESDKPAGPCEPPVTSLPASSLFTARPYLSSVSIESILLNNPLLFFFRSRAYTSAVPVCEPAGLLSVSIRAFMSALLPVTYCFHCFPVCSFSGSITFPQPPCGFCPSKRINNHLICENSIRRRNWRPRADAGCYSYSPSPRNCDSN